MYKMAKEENPTLPIPVDSDEDDISDQPPSYEEATQSPTTPTLLRSILKRGKQSQPEIVFRKQAAPLQFYTPDPKHIKCRCGKHVDTTKRSPHLVAGTVKCSCGYVVSSTGYACHPSQCSSVIPASARKCSCGELFSEMRYDSSTFSCHCGAMFGSDEKAKRLCKWHQCVTGDARNVLCRCGRVLDTTAVYRVLHGTKSFTQGEFSKHPRAGWSHYDYTLPEGTALCECGIFVKRDGSSEVGKHWTCCKVLSCKARESGLASSEESCTCMHS